MEVRGGVNGQVQMNLEGPIEISTSYQGRIREEGMQQSTSKNRMGGGMLLEKYISVK